MSRDVNTAFARALVDEWIRAGLTDAAVAPGSRSTPMALALAADQRVRVHVFLDERSAAFFALGAAKASGRPTAVLCTSGTAAAHLHGAVLEARHSRVPLLVCTADRPPELRDTGAGQTTDQVKLYGSAVRFFADLFPEDHPAAIGAWRPLAARAFSEAVGPPAGPVHLNLAFREPLVPDGSEVPEVPGRDAGSPWTASRPGRLGPRDEDLDRLAAAVGSSKRGVIVAGWGAGCDFEVVGRFARTAGWPVLADPLSGLRQSGRHTVSTYEALLRVPGFTEAHRPDLVLRLGAALTSKAAGAWLDASVPQVLVDPDAAWLDPERSVTERLAADAGLVLDGLAERLEESGPRFPRRRENPGPEWLDGWRQAETAARRALDAFLDGDDVPFEGRVARDVHDCLPPGATLVVASSMPVRDLEAFARPRPGLRVLANRGVNGIDGFTSTVLGVAAGAGAAGGPVAGLMGDLAFLHDAAGLTFAPRSGLDAVLVVVDNDGGGIFSFLPQATTTAVPPEDFESLFGTPHGLDLVSVARSYGLSAERVERAGDVVPTVEKALAAGGVRVLVVGTGDRAGNVARHRAAWAAVAEAVGGP
ncbi:MAG: 2-succinyl-5-enolpyruvyl-6-hydroxy-3-cyclohexene-1-carboxylic-acid synthase [Actinomycetota bacterium]|nr:2-succinyl-5-enolpyruvyl-6-hydroxy-3-cyclohexene-1-carboxylic-acid synthase [Actinomycetota bacterium]